MPKFKLPAVGSIVASVVLVIVVAGVTLGLIYIKGGKQAAAAAAAQATPEFAAAVVSAEVQLTPYTRIRTAIGTVRAFEIGPTAGAFASLGMSLTGVFTALLLPLAWRLLMP